MKTTPLRAIRRQCLYCMCGSAHEVRLCPTKDCSLWEFRFGRGRPKLKDIRAKCFDCGEGTAHAIKNCEFPECPLYIYRLGKNPARKGLGNAKNFKSKTR